MVTIIDFKERQRETGEKFFVLVLSGEPEIIKSQTGNYYATTRKASIPTTFDEKVCQNMLGKKLPGRIVKEECEEYDYELDNGTTIKVKHKYSYNNDLTVEETVFEKEV